MTLDLLLEEARAQPVVGWDFSWLGDRMTTSPLPWDYQAILLGYARESPDLLDLGTGGGERLSALPYRPPRTVATEAWPPNVGVATACLRPLGVTVVAVEGAPDNAVQLAVETRGRLPFGDGSFALVASRHESFVASEVARVLVRGGRFVTQQLCGDFDDFYEALGLAMPTSPRWDLAVGAAQVGAAWLEVEESAEVTTTTTFADAAAFAWYLEATPWTIPDFSVDTHHPQLEHLQERIEAEGPLAIRQGAFWLTATKASR
jgi:SAM-dependent methyltransferase